MNADSVEREFIDQEIDPTAKTFKDLGIEPAELSSLTYHYLVSDAVYSKSYVGDVTLTVGCIARVSELRLLRSPSCDGAGEERREEVFACLG